MKYSLTTKYILLFSLTISFIFFACQKTDTKELELIEIQGAYEIKKGYLDSTNVSYLNYKLITQFPAKNVIDFYNILLKKNNFTPYSVDGYGTAIWETFDYNSGQWGQTLAPPARYITTWVDKIKKKRIVLILIYKYKDKIKTSNQRNESELIVDLKIMDFFDAIKILSIMESK